MTTAARARLEVRRLLPEPECGHRQCGTVRCVVVALRTGLLDDAAARRLGISTRQYRRYVAAVLTMVNATTRFQAGMRIGSIPDGCVLDRFPTWEELGVRPPGQRVRGQEAGAAHVGS